MLRVYKLRSISGYILMIARHRKHGAGNIGAGNIGTGNIGAGNKN